MGVIDFSGDDDEEQEEESNGSLSGTHIYFYEAGHDRVSSHSEKAKEDYDEAYDLAKKGGAVRNYFEDKRGVYGIQHGLAQFVIALGSALDGDFTEIIDHTLAPESEDPEVRQQEAEFYANELAKWLDQNPEVGEILIDRIMTSEQAQEEEEDN